MCSNDSLEAGSERFESALTVKLERARVYLCAARVAHVYRATGVLEQ